MAITGTGTQADPWIVTTYAELVSKADDEGYIKIGNDINIIEEYPNGDMPTLNIVNSVIDGDNKVVSNWYKLSGNAITMQGGASQIHDCTIANIYFQGSDFAILQGNNDNYHFKNCNFYGVLWSSFFLAVDDYGSQKNFDSCSINIKSNSQYNALSGNTYGYFGLRYCYIKVSSKTASNIFDTSRSTLVDSCYIEADIPCGAYSKITNSVVDITSTATFTANGSTGNALCILNSDHAPNASAGDGFALVDDTHWLDTAYLSGIGFNIR